MTKKIMWYLLCFYHGVLGTVCKSISMSVSVHRDDVQMSELLHESTLPHIDCASFERLIPDCAEFLSAHTGARDLQCISVTLCNTESLACWKSTHNENTDNNTAVSR